MLVLARKILDAHVVEIYWSIPVERAISGTCIQPTSIDIRPHLNDDNIISY
jgi:hypothetical protein